MLVNKYLNWLTILRATIKTDKQEIKIQQLEQNVEELEQKNEEQAEQIV